LHRICIAFATPLQHLGIAFALLQFAIYHFALLFIAIAAPLYAVKYHFKLPSQRFASYSLNSTFAKHILIFSLSLPPILVLEDAASDAGVLIELGTNVKSVEMLQHSTSNSNSNSNSNSGFKITYTQRGGEKERGEREECVVDRLIMATGSSRAGFDMMQHLGHAIIAPNPSLFSFKIKDPTLTALSGASVPNARVKLVIPKKFREDHKNLVKPNELAR
jgi:hypothetical protein